MTRLRSARGSGSRHHHLLPGQRPSIELRDFPTTDQAIRQAVRPKRAATEIPAALTPAAGKPVSGWKGGSDGR